MQASRSEGLPNAVMEAMACGCVPVVTDVGGMRELVDTAGIVVSEEADLVQALDKAFHQSELRADPRARIARHYSMRQREEGLVRILEGIWAEG